MAAAAITTAPTTTHVKFMGDLVQIASRRELDVALSPDGTVGDLLAVMSEMFGAAFTDRVFCASGKLQHTVLIFVDEEDIKYRGGLTARIGAGVEILMLPMFGGG